MFQHKYQDTLNEKSMVPLGESLKTINTKQYIGKDTYKYDKT